MGSSAAALPAAAAAPRKKITHTRMGGGQTGVRPGRFHISDADRETFYQLYCDHVFVKKQFEYLTELREPEKGPLLVDLDFRYAATVKERLHTENHILDFLMLYLEELKQFYSFQSEQTIPIYVMEKPGVNCVADCTKDGIHFLFGMQMCAELQLMLRQRILSQIADVLDLPLINSWEKVLDEGISASTIGWTLYGSCKPETKVAYKVTYVYTARFDAEENQFHLCSVSDPEREGVAAFDAPTPANLYKLSAQNVNYPAFELQPSMKIALEKRLEAKAREQERKGSKKRSAAAADEQPPAAKRAAVTVPGKKQPQPVAEPNLYILSDDEDGNDDEEGDGEEDEAPAPTPVPPPAAAASAPTDTSAAAAGGDEIDIYSITDAASLQHAMDLVLANLEPHEQYIRETHAHTQILPAKYYEPGSHYHNRMVAFALKHTDERLFLSWVMLRSKAADFDYSTIPKLYQDWQMYFNKNDTANPVTRKSILFWAKQDAPEAYAALRKQSIDSWIDLSIQSGADWDFAQVLYQMYKDKYVCTSIEHKKWYVFSNHRWIEDKGISLRANISISMFDLYSDRHVESMTRAQQCDDDELRGKIMKKCDLLSKICRDLKSVKSKDRIMREAMEIFFDGDLEEKMDTNPYLLGFTNGVVDFKALEFRPGNHYDYVTKTTERPYISYAQAQERHPEIIDEINTFMSQLYPIESLRRYMWDHLAASLCGKKRDEVFHIYLGTGANGKTVLANLMQVTLKKYYGVVPVQLLTGNARVQVGGHCDELYKLKGIRYGVASETKACTVMDEAVVKELSGNGEIQVRGIRKESETIRFMGTLVMMTNYLPEFNTTDDGTWRRVRQVDHVSKFVDPGTEHTDTTPYVFPKNDQLSERFEDWAPVFMAMLVKRYFETNGYVAPCPEVMQASNAYRKTQDSLGSFVSECVLPGDDSQWLPKTMLHNKFKEWMQMNFPQQRKLPKMADLVAVMERVHGKPAANGKWHKLRLLNDWDD